jgi:hypothetical protein
LMVKSLQKFCVPGAPTGVRSTKKEAGIGVAPVFRDETTTAKLC